MRIVCCNAATSFLGHERRLGRCPRPVRLPTNSRPLVDCRGRPRRAKNHTIDGSRRPSKDHKLKERPVWLASRGPQASAVGERQIAFPCRWALSCRMAQRDRRMRQVMSETYRCNLLSPRFKPRSGRDGPWWPRCNKLRTGSKSSACPSTRSYLPTTASMT